MTEVSPDHFPKPVDEVDPEIAQVLEDVAPAIRAAADLEIDGGELPGLASTVVDLSTEELRIVREGAVPAARIRERLR